MKLATCFSGIGAIEHALDRMKIPHEIVFACDNGGVDIIRAEDVPKIQETLEKFDNYKDRKDYIDNLYKKHESRNQVKKSYFANYDISEENFHWNASLLDGHQYTNKVDLFVGGSPCQSFSIAGKQGGLEDTRGTLFYEYARLVSEIKPKVFIYENVRNVIFHDSGRTWQKMQEVFSSLGYNFYYKILNSKNYGIPQSRERIFVVGFRNDLNVKDFEFPKEIPLEKTMQNLLEENPDKKYYLSEKAIKYVMTPGTKTFNCRPETDLKIARALLATMHKMHRAGVDNYVTTNGKLRKLTPRECLRLMGFSDSFKIVVSDTAMYAQAGNSIVVDVLIHLVRKILEVCPDFCKEGKS